MILHRIGSAIKKQDWSVVLIEIGIVVFGVFIGLQVDDWNNERKERAQEQAILERLLSEAENSVAFISEIVEDWAAQNETLKELIAFISDPDQFPMNEARAANVFPGLSRFPSMKPSRTVLDELTASGQLKLIRSQSIRDAMGQYVAALAWHDGQLENFRSDAGKVMDVSLPYLDARYAPERPGVREIIIDWQALRADKSVIFTAISSLRNLYVFQSYRESVLNDAQNLCDALATEIGLECEPKGAEPAGEE